MNQITSRTASGCGCGCDGHDAGGAREQDPAARGREGGTSSGVVPGRRTGNLLGLRDVSAPASGGCGCGGHQH